ncbi:MAG: hypothetical protein V1930_00815 [Pseudomonadota bacterium]
MSNEAKKGPQPSFRMMVTGIILLTVTIRICFVLVISHPEIRKGEFHPKSDETQYHGLAETLATEGKYRFTPNSPPTAYRSPGIILPLALLYYLLEPLPFVGLIYVWLYGVLTIPVLGVMAFITTKSERVTIAAMIIGAFTPTLWYTSSSIGSDSPANLMILVLLTILLGMRKDGPVWRWAIAGLVLAFAYLNRTTPIFFLLYLFSLGYIFYLYKARKKIIPAILLSIFFFSPIIAWGLRNALVMDRFFIGSTVGGQTLWGSNNPLTAGMALPAIRYLDGHDLYEEARNGHYLGSWVPGNYIPGGDAPRESPLNEMEQYEFYKDKTMRFLMTQPKALIRLTAFKFMRIFTAEPYALSISLEKGLKYTLKRYVVLLERYFILLFGISGLFLFFRKNYHGSYLYLIFILVGTVQLFLSYVNARFFLPITIVMIVPAATALCGLYETALKKMPHKIV